MINDNWKTNQEERANLRMALYEELHDNPKVTYRQLGKEFNIKPTEAKLLIFEYCNVFNLNPPVDRVGTSVKKEKVYIDNLDKKIKVNGRDAIVINEHTKTIVVRFQDNSESETISKKTNQICRVRKEMA